MGSLGPIPVYFGPWGLATVLLTMEDGAKAYVGLLVWSTCQVTYDLVTGRLPLKKLGFDSSVLLTVAHLLNKSSVNKEVSRQCGPLLLRWCRDSPSSHISAGLSQSLTFGLSVSCSGQLPWAQQSGCPVGPLCVRQDPLHTPGLYIQGGHLSQPISAP